MMKRVSHSLRVILLSGILSLVVISTGTTPARADVAPPESPPGSNIVPGSSTQVRMLSEVVTLTVLSQPAANTIGQAKTDARFIMHNLGSAAESINVRFPLTYFDGRGDGFGNFPEIKNILIEVNGSQVQTKRILDSYTAPGSSSSTSTQVPWASFNVSFPPGQDVNIHVVYIADGFGYGDYFALRYVLETGAAWSGTIGSADVIVKLPYDANAENVILGDGTTGFSQTTPGAQLSASEVRWHFSDFEPTTQDNIEITLVVPAVWHQVQTDTETVTGNPKDGEAWGRLGKLYKEIVRIKRGFRTDAGATGLYDLSFQAYQKAVTLLPKDALWHYGFADLLVSKFDDSVMTQSSPNYAVISLGASEIQKSLAIDPLNQDVQALAAYVANQYPWAISQNGGSLDYLVLTATPTTALATDTALPTIPEASPTIAQPASPVATQPSPIVTQPTGPTQAPPRPTDAPAGLPFCGGALLVLPLFAGVLKHLLRR